MTGNIQYLRTDRAIQSALLSLLGKKPFEKITVQDILDETPVSRATFYKHSMTNMRSWRRSRTRC